MSDSSTDVGCSEGNAFMTDRGLVNRNTPAEVRNPWQTAQGRQTVTTERRDMTTSPKPLPWSERLPRYSLTRKGRR